MKVTGINPCAIREWVAEAIARELGRPPENFRVSIYGSHRRYSAIVHSDDASGLNAVYDSVDEHEFNVHPARYCFIEMSRRIAGKVAKAKAKATPKKPNGDKK